MSLFLLKTMAQMLTHVLLVSAASVMSSNGNKRFFLSTECSIVPSTLSLSLHSSLSFSLPAHTSTLCLRHSHSCTASHSSRVSAADLRLCLILSSLLLSLLLFSLPRLLQLIFFLSILHITRVLHKMNNNYNTTHTLLHLYLPG